MVVQHDDGFVYQLVGLEIDSIVGLVVDSPPQFLELLAFELLRVEVGFAHLTGVLGFHGLGIEDAVELADDILFVVFVVAKIKLALLLVIVE